MIVRSLLPRFCSLGCAAAIAGMLGAPTTAKADPTEQQPAFAPQADVPRGTYVRVPAVDSLGAPPRPQAGGAPHIIYLNRCTGGLTLTSGWPDDNIANRSGILNGTTTLPQFAYGDDAWAQVMEETRSIFAPFNVVITDVDPAPAAHDEAVVCGSGQDAGWGGAGGVAPFSCGVIDKPITFTFPESLGGNPRTIAEVIGQEAAHAWGLEHEYKCEDPMTYLNGCGQKTYQDGDYPCGEYSAVSCECGGATQNSYQYILGLFGSATPDAGPPSASITYPTDGEIFAPGSNFDLTVSVTDDVMVTSVQLFANAVADMADASEPWGPWEITNIPAGDYDFYIVAEDGAGNSTVSNTVSISVTNEDIPPDTGDSDTSPGSGPDPSGGGESSSGGDSDPSSDSLDPDEDASDADADSNASAGINDGALPTNYGAGLGEGGCACTTSSPQSTGWGFLFVLFGLSGMAGLPGRRRRR